MYVSQKLMYTWKKDGKIRDGARRPYTYIYKSNDRQNRGSEMSI